MILWILLLIVVGFAAYVRLAPSDATRWHRPAEIAGTESKTLKGGYIWRKAVEGDGKAALEAFAKVASAAPRTITLAGSAGEGQITFISRTALWGFPDYITASLQQHEGQTYLEVYGRLRFGKSDLGVNAKRIQDWIAQAQL